MESRYSKDVFPDIEILSIQFILCTIILVSVKKYSSIFEKNFDLSKMMLWHNYWREFMAVLITVKELKRRFSFSAGKFVSRYTYKIITYIANCQLLINNLSLSCLSYRIFCNTTELEEPVPFDFHNLSFILDIVFCYSPSFVHLPS